MFALLWHFLGYQVYAARAWTPTHHSTFTKVNNRLTKPENIGNRGADTNWTQGPIHAKTVAMADQTLFVTGFSQGGTTLLLSLLDGHPDIAAYPDEPHFLKLLGRLPQYRDGAHLLLDSLTGTPNLLGYPATTPVARRKSKTAPASTGDTAAATLADLARRNAAASDTMPTLRGLSHSMPADAQSGFFRRYYTDLLQKPPATADLSQVIQQHLRAAARAANPAQNPTFHAFKEPFNDLANLRRLDDFLGHFPKAQTLFIARNPFARLNSMLGFLGQLQRGYRLRANPLRFLRLAQKNARDYRAFQSWAQSVQARPDIHIIQYEDLVRDPEPVLRSLCGDLGLAFDETLLNPTKLGHPVDLPTNRTGRARAISAAGIDKWRAALTGAEIALQRAFLRAYRVSLPA